MQASYILCSLVHVLEKYTLFFSTSILTLKGWGGGGGGGKAFLEGGTDRIDHSQ